MSSDTTEATVAKWFAMRDLKRPNALLPAYQMLSDNGFQVFTPLIDKIVTKSGRRSRVTVPVIQDLLFVRSDKTLLDRVVEKTPTLQYRYLKGGSYCQPIVVPKAEMDRFINAVSFSQKPLYFSPDEITPSMLASEIKIISQGPLNGLTGRLVKIKGSKKKRVMVELQGLLIAAVEISSADFIEII